jgi:hypothetical protein
MAGKESMAAAKELKELVLLSKELVLLSPHLPLYTHLRVYIVP